MPFLDELAARRRFGMKPGLDTIRSVCAALGDPQRKFRAIHVAGTNGKGAVCAMLDAMLRTTGSGVNAKGGNGPRVGRYTSPHLVRLNERFFLDGAPMDDAALDRAAARVAAVAPEDLTFFEALTAVAFLLYAEAECDHVVLETGLGGRLDATNVCEPELCVITKIGLDHCDWLGDTVEKIAAEKAGIIKPGVPIVLGRNEPSVRAVVEARASSVGAPFFYAPDLVAVADVPASLSLVGSFNRENAVTAQAAAKVLGRDDPAGLADVVWPGRFQRVGRFIVDGAHNPPAAWALRESLVELLGGGGSCAAHRVECQARDARVRLPQLNLIAGFCGDKDVGEVLSILSPLVRRGLAVQTNNPRSLKAAETAAKMRAAGMDAAPCPSLRAALAEAERLPGTSLICGSLFLAGEALVELGAYPWGVPRFDKSELLRP